MLGLERHLNPSFSLRRVFVHPEQSVQTTVLTCSIELGLCVQTAILVCGAPVRLSFRFPTLSRALKRRRCCLNVVISGRVRFQLAGLGGLPEGVFDLWELTGSRPECRYTWDLTRNDNLVMPGNFKARWDPVESSHAWKRKAGNECKIV